MNKIINFDLIRIQSDLDRYSQGLANIESISSRSVESIKTEYYEKLTKEYQIIADSLIDDYHKFIDLSKEDIMESLKEEYLNLLFSSQTHHDEFQIPKVLQKYRQGINPVQALYYEIRHLHSLVRENISLDDADTWLINLVCEPKFYSKLMTALETDIVKLKSIIVRYYHTLDKTDNIPMELFHAKQRIEEFSECCAFFKKLKAELTRNQ